MSAPASFLVLAALHLLPAQQCADHHPAQRFRRAHGPVQPIDDHAVLVEAEEFAGGCPLWRAQDWGDNYYAGTFANTFLSRQAFLSAPPQPPPGPQADARIQVQVPQAGRYLVLARYEAPYRHQAQFTLRIEQGGQVRFARLYGARDQLKIWPFGHKLQREVAFSWGATENLVWEGHDAYADLAAGPATLVLLAGQQPEPAARRNVDAVLLTTDHAQVQARIDKEGYLPLDGLLTQAGDLYLRVRNFADGAPVKLTVPCGTEHSPYWIHQRGWKPRELTADRGASSDWVEVGSLLDTLNAGQWNLSARAQAAPAAQTAGALHYQVELARRERGGAWAPLGSFESREATLQLAYDGNTRYSGRVRRADQVLYDLVALLRKNPPPGGPPRQTLVYATIVEPRPDDRRYTAAREDFRALLGLTLPELPQQGALRGGFIDVRGQDPAKLQATCQRLAEKGLTQAISVVSLGDEIALADPPHDDHLGFRAWLKAHDLRPGDVDPEVGDDLQAVRYDLDPALAESRPGVFYSSRLYRDSFGIAAQKRLTDVLRACLPRAVIGANYSPHADPPFLGDAHKWISVFREGGMTMPWGEDYIFQMPVGSQQMNGLMLDLFRSGLRGEPGPIQYYVMAHSPGNTPTSWRRQFYTDLAHGMKIVNLFEFRPVQLTYTENSSSDPRMYRAVQTALYELSGFEDLLQAGRVRPGVAALWFGETGDIWGDERAPFAAAKRTLYVAIRHQQLPLDIVVEEDALLDRLGRYKVLYLTDQHVSGAAAAAIARWVQGGGVLLGTAGAGLLDERSRPSVVMQELFGITPQPVEAPAEQAIGLEKQDLPFAKALDRVSLGGSTQTMPIFGARARFGLHGARERGTFSDGTSAMAVKEHGAGLAIYCGFLPGLSYFQPALPLRPVDRGSDHSLAHFVPTAFDPVAGALIAEAAAGVKRPVVSAEPLVETTVIEAPKGVLIPLINWSGAPRRRLVLTTSLPVPAGQVRLASGHPVQVTQSGGTSVFTLDLDVADMLILRRGD